MPWEGFALQVLTRLRRLSLDGHQLGCDHLGQRHLFRNRSAEQRGGLTRRQRAELQRA